MSSDSPFVPTFADISPALRTALEGRGFTAFTPIQEAVLDPELAGRDIRIFSQTGSGKTVAVGLAVAPDLERLVKEGAPAHEGGKAGAAHPFVLCVAPTRELATQIATELTWLFEPLGVIVTSVTGGASYVRELAALRRGPQVIVGTPGRLLDHMSRKSIDPSAIGVVVLDEADQMLDLGFKDELDAILAQTPEGRRTLLLSATFPREVQRLADRCQKNWIVAAGANAGERNEDITFVAHLVLAEERAKLLINLLLMAPGERALVFVRTRDGASELAERLSDAGLPARAIHGDLEQRDRTRTLDAFRSGGVMTLVATDVAARGLDVPDVMRVIHADPPGDAEVLTHRSGRTGRAGKKGTSIVLVPPGMRERVRQMLRRAGVEAAWTPAPQAADVLRAIDERLATELSSDAAPTDARLLALADKLIAGREAREVIATLLARVERTGAVAPADITPIHLPSSRAAQTMPPARGEPRGRGPRGGPAAASGSFVPFRINWGERQGADARRLLALVCRRGGIRGSEVGAIRIGVAGSTFEVAANVAEAFTRAAREPDARDPRVQITPMQDGGVPARRERPGPPRGAGHAREPAHAAAPPEASETAAPRDPAIEHAAPAPAVHAAPPAPAVPAAPPAPPAPHERAAPPPPAPEREPARPVAHAAPAQAEAPVASGAEAAPRAPRADAPAPRGPRNARAPGARGGFVGAAPPRRDRAQHEGAATTAEPTASAAAPERDAGPRYDDRRGPPPTGPRDHAPRTPYRGADEKPGAPAPSAHGKPPYGKPAYGKPAYGKPAYGKPAYGKHAAGKPPFTKPAAAPDAAPSKKAAKKGDAPPKRRIVVER
jgi:ATP-dependent RNA helicase DeaD